MTSNGTGNLAAGIIVALSIGVGAFLIGGAVDRAADKLTGVEVALSQLANAIGDQPEDRPSPRQARAPRRGPDPGRNYTVNTVGSPALGPDDAKVTIVEFSDFQCPFCARVHPTLQRVRNEYGDRVRFVFKHLPLSMHPKAPAAHAAAEAAGLQGKFWQMRDKIFENQREMSESRYLEWAQELGIDLERFKADVASAGVQQAVDRDLDEAKRLGVTGTPAFFVNGRFLSGAQPFSAFKTAIDAALKG